MQWLHEPPHWHQTDGIFHITAAPRTDFWRKTHDGSIRDNGHFYFQHMSGDFVAQVKVSGQYTDLYDQAGLMIRQDETCWLKCGIEYVNGVQHASAVVTRDWSDWSILPLENPPAIWLKLERHGATVEVSYSLDGQDYSLIRQAFLSEAESLQVGLMMAAPTGNGFAAAFEGFSVQELPEKDTEP